MIKSKLRQYTATIQVTVAASIYEFYLGLKSEVCNMTEFDLSQYLKELECLVNIDSVSSEPTGTAQIAEMMKEKYESIGWQVKQHQFAPSIGPCLELTNGEADEYDVLLLAHMDTVFPIGTAQQRPFSIKENRAYGPGVNDCKAGMLSGFYVMKYLTEHKVLAGKSVCVFLNSDHEGISSKYSRTYSEMLAKKSRYVLVLEAGRANGNLVNKRKGIGRYHITIHGVAAHAGVDHKSGKNAIEELAHWILALQKRTDYIKETTLNIGMVSGGVSISAVPAEAKAALDVRYYDVKEAEAIEKLMQDMAEHPHVVGTTATFAGGITRPPMIPTEKTMQLCQSIDEIGAEIGVDFSWMASGGGSDGSFAAAAGTPTIDGLGPVGGGAHSSAEYMEIDTVIPRYELLCRILMHILRKK